ncbi:MAG TPA: flagellar motor switch phosphatase FliY, partial [Calditerricola sp.]
MKDRDKLSQEEIDALLRGLGENAEADRAEPQPEAVLSPIEQDALGEIGNISFGSAATALSTLLGQKVEITTPTVTLVRRDALRDEFPDPHIAIFVEYTDGLEGTNLLVLRTEDARIIADLMMGGDGTHPDPELTELHLSAVQEAMNQMMGSAATSMSTVFKRRVNISPPVVRVFDLSKPDEELPLPDETLVKVSFRLRVGTLIDSTIMQLNPLSFAVQMVKSLFGDMGAMGQATTPAAPEQREELAPAQREEPAPADPGASPPTASAQLRPGGHEAAASAERSTSGVRDGGDAGAFASRMVNVQPVQFAPLHPDVSAATESNLSLLYDVPLQVTVELGRTEKTIKEILELTSGSIVELDKLAGEPVDILVNGK